VSSLDILAIAHLLRGSGPRVSKHRPQAHSDPSRRQTVGLIGARHRRLAFYGNFGTTNFGNDSTLEAALQNLFVIDRNVDVLCICTGPESVSADQKIVSIPVAEIFFKNWSPRWAAGRLVRKACVGILLEPVRWLTSIVRLLRVEMLIVPGTGLLTDASGVTGWGQYYLFKWALLAKLCRCKLVFMSVGAGPIYSRLGRVLIKIVLGLADYRSYRDRATKQYLNSIGIVTDGDDICPDLAFSLPKQRPTEREQIGKPQIVGMGLMAYPGRYSDEHPIDHTFLNYLTTHVDLSEWLSDRGYITRLLIGDQADRKAVSDFKRILSTRQPNESRRRVIDEPIQSVEDLITQIETSELIIATRFHNVVLAALANKPVLSISFHHKCTSLMEALGLSQFCLDIHGLRAQDLIAAFSELEENADVIKSLMRQKVAGFRQDLVAQYSRVFIDMRARSGDARYPSTASTTA
jgi:polysaccharide pyruvyl transferase WcaK-like protein